MVRMLICWSPSVDKILPDIPGICRMARANHGQHGLLAFDLDIVQVQVLL